MWGSAAIAIILALAAPSGTTFDLSTDFSLQNNPGKVWQYGYSANNSLDPAQFRLDAYSDNAEPVGFWHPGTSYQPGPGWYPYIAHNSANRTELGSMKGWSVARG